MTKEADDQLIDDFANALKEKMAVNRKKGKAGWQETDWLDTCKRDMFLHMAKGDPRDVAIYAAFLWYHDEKTSGIELTQEQLNEIVTLMAMNDETIVPVSNKQTPMNIRTKPGCKVRMVYPNNGYPADSHHVKKHLIEGEIYTLLNVRVSGWVTKVELEECPGLTFNSVHFINHGHIELNEEPETLFGGQAREK